MLYCPEGINITQIWINHGLSDCFIDTFSASFMAFFLFTFGGVQIWIYGKYSSRINSHDLIASKLYILQLIFSLVLGALVVARSIFQATVINHGVIYGYMILSTGLMVIVYAFSAILIYVERNYLLPSVPPRGHGLVLLFFWTIMFIFENLMFINLHRPDWWTDLKTTVDRIQLALFVSKYVTSLFVFVLGLKAPGIKTSIDYINLGEQTSIPVSVRTDSWYF